MSFARSFFNLRRQVFSDWPDTVNYVAPGGGRHSVTQNVGNRSTDLIQVEDTSKSVMEMCVCTCIIVYREIYHCKSKKGSDIRLTFTAGKARRNTLEKNSDARDSRFC